MFNPKKTRFTQPLSSSHLSQNAHGLHIREYQGKKERKKGRYRSIQKDQERKEKKTGEKKIVGGYFEARLGHKWGQDP